MGNVTATATEKVLVIEDNTRRISGNHDKKKRRKLYLTRGVGTSFSYEMQRRRMSIVKKKITENYRTRIYIAVSYTHLDVYKRQFLNIPNCSFPLFLISMFKSK